MSTTVNTREMWVIHSPYPDHTWRGIEKCVHSEELNGLLLFETAEDAQDRIESREIPFFYPVRILLTTPSVRNSLEAIEDSASMIESSLRQRYMEILREGFNKVLREEIDTFKASQASPNDANLILKALGAMSLEDTDTNGWQWDHWTTFEYRNQQFLYFRTTKFNNH